MSVVYTDITLENAADVAKARDGMIKEPEIRRLEVRALVDTGAWNLVINEETRQKLGLSIIKEDTVEIANDNLQKCGISESVTVWWKDRFVACNAIVLPEESRVLLGAFPLEGLDLTINPKREIIGKHGDSILRMVK